MILGGALITQYIKKEEEEPARFQKASESVRQWQADSVEYCGVVLEEDDSVSLYSFASTSLAFSLDISG
jgi:hypothetical protein